MKRIGLLSDTHSWWDDKYLIHFADCDEIWHAGDIGSELVINQLESHCPVRAVHGNIDGQEIRRRYGEVLKFKVEGYDPHWRLPRQVQPHHAQYNI